MKILMMKSEASQIEFKCFSDNAESIRKLAAKYELINPRVFGSVARGTSNSDSDIDIIVDISPDTTLFNLGGFQAELELLLGVRVDVLTPSELPPHVLSKVLHEARPI